jgi:signal transduction histidine kinase
VRDEGGIRLRTWRTWLGAIVVAVTAASLAQFLLHRFFMRLGMLGQHIVSGAFHAAIIAIPVILFLAWRTEARAERELYERLESAESARDDLVHMLVHDLKSPVISAGLALKAVIRDSKEGRCGTDHEQEMLDIAAESLRRAEKMIGDILTASKADAGKLRPKPTEEDLGAIVRRQVDLSRPRAEDRNQELRAELERAELPVSIDAPMVRRVIDNLLENAIENTPKGGSVEVAVSKNDGEAMVSVKDTGAGIPDEFRGLIFEKYGQVEVRERGVPSAGLGLIVSRLIVEAHGGRIWLERAGEHGSDFRFTIPLRSK